MEKIPEPGEFVSFVGGIYKCLQFGVVANEEIKDGRVVIITGPNDKKEKVALSKLDTSSSEEVVGNLNMHIIMALSRY